MADRIKNYQQEADQITTLKAIRTDLGVTPSSYTPDATVVTKDRVVTFAQAEEELVVLGDIEKGVKQQVTEVDIAQKDIANIKALLQGHLYDYQTDSTSAYTKTVPSGAMPYAGLEKIGGKTVVWNQLVDSGTTAVSTISGHKYYTLIDGTASIVTADGTAITIVDDTADMVVDLTLCFGAGNEPTTTDEVESMFPADYYAYNAGTLLSAGVTEVVSDGYNHINETYLQSQWTYADGVYSGSVSPIYTGFADSIDQTWKEKTAYFLTADVGFFAGDSEWLRWQVHYTDGTMQESNSSSNQTGFDTISITTNPNKTIDYVRWYINNGFAGKFKNIIVREANPLQTYPIPTAIRNLEGYGWSAGSVYNKIDFERKVFIKRVGSVDLGSLTWEYLPNGYFMARTPSDARTSQLQGIPIICAKYESYYSRQSQFTSSDKSIICNSSYVGPNTIFVRDSAYSDATIFKSAVHNVYMYYALQTEVETDISTYLTDDNLIEVESGGTLTFENSNGDDYRLPVPSDVTYMIDLQEAINNG